MVTSPRRWQFTVQGWLVLVLSLTGVVVLICGVATTLLLNRTDRVSRELTEEIQPARVAAYQLQAALGDQESAVRGYLIAADTQFLEPYFEGQAAETRAAAEIRHRVGDRPQLIADLEAIQETAATWRATYAEPQIAGVEPGSRPDFDTAAAEEGKAQFDQLRALFDTQSEHLFEARTAGITDMSRAQAWRNGVLITMLLAILVTALLLATMVRRAVTRPLEALAAACRRITEGNFGERINPRGPKDIRAIAADVEDMRQRIVDELEVSHTGRAVLAQQAEALDEQAVELRRSNAELEQFAYVASHDLQEPLRKIASFCQLLEKRYGDQLDARGHEYIKFAVDGAKRMQILINDLLTFSRVGRLNTKLAEVELTAAFDDALDNLSEAVEESGVQIVRPEQPLPTVTGDPTLLTMLFQNLIGNAMKFRRPEVPPRVVVECGPAPESFGEGWLIRVADNGIGIPEEFAEKVFVIFQRLHGRDVYSGTGIGLALCKKIVEYHGGTIWIDPSYTDGTRFCFTLPLTVDDGVAVEQEGTRP
ncbi:histidine kinase [Mycolicibacterium chitae]|uniref:histidine kinase n=1 Tax=Mycolicibacterium chitae TaxID=1792 RepID=A0A448I751_MYCCI|nr:histidine kinase [Mycolicibacterium chitae]VEG48154.1 two-component system sensor kinase [Mycolicibacterium chitae]